MGGMKQAARRRRQHVATRNGKKVTRAQLVKLHNRLVAENERLQAMVEQSQHYLRWTAGELVPLRDALLELEPHVRAQDEMLLDAAGVADVVDVLDRLIEPLGVDEEVDDAE